MRNFKKATAMLLALATVFSLTVSANAAFGALIGSGSKETDKIGVPAVIRGEIYFTTDDPSGLLWLQVTAVTNVDSRYTMAEVGAKLECQYNSTGELVRPTATGSEYARNTNSVEAGCEFSKPEPGRVAVHSTHEATYTRSDFLYMITLI